MNGKLVSIIVPIYKVEKYIKKCIEYLVAQDYFKIETTLLRMLDNCAEIISKFEEDKDMPMMNGGVC